MKATFAPNPLDSHLDCTVPAVGEFRIAIAEAVQPIADLAAELAPILGPIMLRLRPKWPRRSFKQWGRR